MPWFLRNPEISTHGDIETFFDRVGHRLKQFILYNEAHHPNLSQLADCLESESHQRFRFDPSPTNPVHLQIHQFFKKEQITREIDNAVLADPEVKKATVLLDAIARESYRTNPSPLSLDLSPKYQEEKRQHDEVMANRRQVHWKNAINARLTVLELLFRIEPLPYGPAALTKLRTDIRSYLAANGVMLDISEHPFLIVPMDEALLQREVIDKLLPRLQSRFPERAKDLVNAYHDLIKGVDTNTVFGNAFKALEEIARAVTSNPNLELNDSKGLVAYFTNIHPTILKTIRNLADHRGDEGAHGRQGPDEREMRYLLFTICNIALLLLDYSEGK